MGLVLNFPLLRVAELSVGVWERLVLVRDAEACFWNTLATVDLTLGPDTSSLGDGGQESGLETGFWIPIVDQSILTWILLGFPSPSILPFLGLASSQGQD